MHKICCRIASCPDFAVASGESPAAGAFSATSQGLTLKQMIRVTSLGSKPLNSFEGEAKSYGVFAQLGKRLDVFYPMPNSWGLRLEGRRRHDHSQDCCLTFNELLPVVSGVN
jgi:hypothetical protein